MGATTEKSTLELILNGKDYHNFLEGRTIHKYGEDGTENIFIFIHPEDFPINKDSKQKPADNFGIVEPKEKIYIIKISLCELIDPIKNEVSGYFIDPDNNSKYSKFEIKFKFE